MNAYISKLIGMQIWNSNTFLEYVMKILHHKSAPDKSLELRQVSLIVLL